MKYLIGIAMAAFFAVSYYPTMAETFGKVNADLAQISSNFAQVKVALDR